jgi:glycine/D-amino acid oxidase-like deaminating enzyme
MTGARRRRILCSERLVSFDPRIHFSIHQTTVSTVFPSPLLYAHVFSIIRTYISTSGGGTILGGCLQHKSWDPLPDPNLAVRIMKRSVDVCPALTDGKGIEALSIVRHGVGLRPMREGGPRVEADKAAGVWTVHAYGHGGYGYQASYGTAKMVVELVEEGVGVGKGKAKL